MSALLFDLDGTLVHTAPDIITAARKMLSTLDLPAGPGDDELVRFIGHGVEHLARCTVEAATGRGRIPPDELSAAVRVLRGHYREGLVVESRPYDGIDALLQGARRAQRPVGVVTNKPQELAQRVVDHFWDSDLIPVVVGGDTTPHKKPNATPLRHALRRLGETEVMAMMVGDLPVDMRAAKAAGIVAAGVTWGYGRREQLASAGADYILDSVAELHRVLRLPR